MHSSQPCRRATGFTCALVITVAVLGGAVDAFGELRGSFENREIGEVGQSGYGYADPETGQWFVGGAGADIWGTSDAFHYMYISLDGDADIVFRVTRIADTHPFAKAGLMIRESLAPDSRHALVNVRPDGSWEFLTRTESGGFTTAAGGRGAGVPRFMRIVRTGNQIEGFVSLSSGGESFWTSVGRVSLTMPQVVYFGLAVTSHDPATVNASTFESVAWNPGSELPAGWTTQNIGDTGETGGTYAVQDSLLVAGAGADLWGTADAFRYVSQPVSGDVEIVARVRHPENTHTFAKAGVMLREALTPDSAHVVLDVRPDGTIEFMTRDRAGAATSFVAGGTVPWPPVWLKLARSGTTVTGSVSTGGEWTTIGSVETSMGDAAHVGLAVTSHDPGVTNASWFSQVSVAGGAGPPPPAEEIVIYANQRGISPHGAWEPSIDAGAADGFSFSTVNHGYSFLDSPLASPEHYVDVPFNAIAELPYTIWLRLRASSDSKWNDSVWVQFSDALVNGVPTYRADTTSALLVNLATDSTASSLSAWGWANGAYWLSQPATVTFASTGPQTLRIQVREDGVAFDQIVLSSGRYLNTPPGPPTDDDTIVRTD